MTRNKNHKAVLHLRRISYQESLVIAPMKGVSTVYDIINIITPRVGLWLWQVKLISIKKRRSTHRLMRSLLICNWLWSISNNKDLQMVRSNLCTFCTYVVWDRMGRHCRRAAVSLKRSWVISNFNRSFSAFWIIASSSAQCSASLIASLSLKIKRRNIGNKAVEK